MGRSLKEQAFWRIGAEGGISICIETTMFWRFFNGHFCDFISLALPKSTKDNAFRKLCA